MPPTVLSRSPAVDHPSSWPNTLGVGRVQRYRHPLPAFEIPRPAPPPRPRVAPPLAFETRQTRSGRARRLSDTLKQGAQKLFDFGRRESVPEKPSIKLLKGSLRGDYWAVGDIMPASEGMGYMHEAEARRARERGAPVQKPRPTRVVAKVLQPEDAGLMQSNAMQDAQTLRDLQRLLQQLAANCVAEETIVVIPSEENRVHDDRTIDRAMEDVTGPSNMPSGHRIKRRPLPSRADVEPPLPYIAPLTFPQKPHTSITASAQGRGIFKRSPDYHDPTADLEKMLKLGADSLRVDSCIAGHDELVLTGAPYPTRSWW
ncbi:hypothetical protein LTR53_014662 [Teratosphaeriaceae sp. CCFEE 6253]|nr:hypothetical protein LTR53_014662 [Teratosphaeriaceae sp. CCFEE 6253]